MMAEFDDLLKIIKNSVDIPGLLKYLEEKEVLQTSLLSTLSEKDVKYDDQLFDLFRTCIENNCDDKKQQQILCYLIKITKPNEEEDLDSLLQLSAIE